MQLDFDLIAGDWKAGMTFWRQQELLNYPDDVCKRLIQVLDAYDVAYNASQAEKAAVVEEKPFEERVPWTYEKMEEAPAATEEPPAPAVPKPQPKPKLKKGPQAKRKPGPLDELVANAKKSYPDK